MTSHGLNGRRVVILGATGTIGGSIARSLLAKGATVMAVGRNAEAIAALHESGAHILRMAIEGSTNCGARLAGACEDVFGSAVDGLVICSGTHGPIGATRDIDIDELRAYTDVHLVGVVGSIIALAPLLDCGSSPVVIAMSGGGATGARARYSPYAMAKVALVRLVENVALEEPGWRVNAIAPGFIASAIHDTTLLAGLERSGEDPTALRARLAQSDDIARVTGLVDLLVAPDGPRATGRLISAQWDPWDDPAWMDRLARDPALGRIRRIDDHEFGTVTRGEPA